MLPNAPPPSNEKPHAISTNRRRGVRKSGDAMDLTFLLKSCKLFSDLDARELDAVQQIALRKDFRKGQIIFNEGDASRGFYVVAAGAVKIFRVGPDGRERVLHIVERGETFAEAAMFMDAYPADAETLAATTAIFIEKNGFKRLLAHDPKLSFKIMGTLVRWLAVLRNALTDLTLKEVPARFASYALSLQSDLSAEASAKAERHRNIAMSVSKTTVAQMIGTTKETFSRLLARLARARVLTWRGKQLRVLNCARLKKIANGEERI
jgi:CRP/FNR family transcriptional regulator